MTILLYIHFGTFRNFKHYYLFFIKGTMKSYFPKAVSYNRFVELESRVFFPLMFFLNQGTFGTCTGITFVDSTIILRKRYIIETINDMLKNTAQIVHSRHRSVSNFIMNLISALGTYCFFDNKPKALQGYCIEDTKQLDYSKGNTISFCLLLLPTPNIMGRGAATRLNRLTVCEHLLASFCHSPRWRYMVSLARFISCSLRVAASLTSSPSVATRSGWLSLTIFLYAVLTSSLVALGEMPSTR